MLSASLRPLVQTATEHARAWNDGDDHTVAAALLTASGRSITGLNTYHFLGGPCAEVTALANHAATCPQDPVVAVVAVYGPTQNVIAPCGKCRQILFDRDPSITCVVRTANGLEAAPVADLLPHAYDWRAAAEVQRLFMWEGYEAAIRDGSKRQTIRVDDPFHHGPATIMFEKEGGDIVTIAATVNSVVSTTRGALTKEQARLDGFADLAELHEALDRHYPGLATDDPVDVVTFDLAE